MVLTKRQLQVLRLAAEGYNQKQVAFRLHISEATVKTHIRDILPRLNAMNTANAIYLATRMKLLC